MAAIRNYGLLAAALFCAAAAASPTSGRADVSCCNVVELRQYTLRPNTRESFIELFDGTFADPLDATGMTVMGQFRDLDRPNRFVWIRGFQTMGDRARELAAFYDGDLWHSRSREANASIDDSDNVLLLEPLSLPLRLSNIPPRPAPAGAGTPGGLIVLELYYTRPNGLLAFGKFFDQTLRNREEAAGAQTLAAYVTSTQANNYPRLPVRTGESVFVWMARFASPGAYAAFRAKLDADRNWTQTVWPSARLNLTRDPEILRLSPTPRSRLRG
jgi:NIPSNAP protein